MINSITSLIPYLVLISHAVFVFLVLTLIFRKALGMKVQMFLGRNSVLLAFLISLVAIVGSLFYSEVIGYEPCVLCWWQRVFLYPLVIIFGMALWKKLSSAFLYSIPFIILGGIIAVYQSYISLGGNSILPCTAVGSACAKVYVMSFGYITIPFMSLTIVAYLILLTWANKIYNDDKNSNA